MHQSKKRNIVIFTLISHKQKLLFFYTYALFLGHEKLDKG